MSETSSSMLGKSAAETTHARGHDELLGGWKLLFAVGQDDANPHQALQACSNLVMTTDLKTAL